MSSVCQVCLAFFKCVSSMLSVSSVCIGVKLVKCVSSGCQCVSSVRLVSVKCVKCVSSVCQVCVKCVKCVSSVYQLCQGCVKCVKSVKWVLSVFQVWFKCVTCG